MPLRAEIVVTGKLRVSCTVGSMIFIATSGGFYLCHTEWVEALDLENAHRVRALWATGNFRLDELAQMYGTSKDTVIQAVTGTGRFVGLPKIAAVARDHRSIRNRRLAATRSVRGDLQP